MNTSRITALTSRAAVSAAAAVAVDFLSLGVSPSPALTAEFEPVPHLSAASVCESPGGKISTLMSNSGNADAHFLDIVGGGAPHLNEDIVVPPGGQVERVIQIFADGKASTITRSLDGPTVEVGTAFLADCDRNLFLEVHVVCADTVPSPTLRSATTASSRPKWICASMATLCSDWRWRLKRHGRDELAAVAPRGSVSEAATEWTRIRRGAERDERGTRSTHRRRGAPAACRRAA